MTSFLSPGRRLAPALLCIAAAGLSACGSSTSSSASSQSQPSAGGSSSSSSSTTGVNPNQRETLPPGDIPDSIRYVPFHFAPLGLTVSSPEGWARAVSGGTLTFTDKLNRIQVFAGPGGASPPTPSSVRGAELSSLTRLVQGFSLQSITRVSRPAGPAVRIAYLGLSKPDPVTGKVGTLAFERYDFFHNRREIVVLVSSPKGSDNVDPWRKVTSSLTFTR